MYRRALLLIAVTTASFVACSGGGVVPIAGGAPGADAGASTNGEDAAGTSDANAVDSAAETRACKPIAGYKPAPHGFSIPTRRCGTSFDAFASTSASFAYTLLDVSGDGRSDLVVTRDGCADGVGEDRWDVYRAEVDGFSPKPVDFALPAARCAGKLDLTTNTSNALRHATFDVDGDAFVDLVILRDDCDPSVGTTRWDVYPGSSSGFAKSPRAHVLPAPRCAKKWDATSASGSVAYAAVDLTGDGVLDLVVTADDCDAAIGADHWDLYEGTASGFAAKPTPFSLPAARCNARFDAMSGSQSVSWSLLDMDGDRRVDLVVTADDCDTEIGVAHWDVYRGAANGFAPTPGAHALPATRCGSDYREAARSGAVAYGLMDFDCDHVPELVITKDDCAKAVGASHWEVYGGSASGFAKAPKTIAVPPARCHRPFDATSASGSVSYGTFSLASKGARELVVAHDTCDDDIGATRWDVYQPR